MKEQILELREKGYSYKQIVAELGCSIGTVAYHCGDGQKEKTKQRVSRSRLENPLAKKFYVFRAREFEAPRETIEASLLRGLKEKIRGFQRRVGSKLGERNNTFTASDVLDLHGESPICYLTGDKIDLNKPSQYSLDHIVPAARGGSNELSNLGFTTKQANMAKSDMTLDEFIELCIKVLVHNEIIEEKRIEI